MPAGNYCGLTEGSPHVTVLTHRLLLLLLLLLRPLIVARRHSFAPLGDLLSNVKPNVGLASDQGAAMMHGLCTGLAYLHNVHHLAHLDLKCENILVSPSFSAKIADFDAAMRIGSTMRQVRGTADVHPPEYLAAAGPRAEHTITASADMWAVGLIAHVVLFGRYLWDRADSNDAKYLAYRESPLATLPPNTPPGLARFFADCFAVDECARVSAADAVDRLAHDWLDWALVWHAPPRPAAPKRKTSRPLVRKLGQLFSSSRRRGRTDQGRT